MNDRIVLVATATLVLFFFVGGMFDILEHFLSRMFLFVGFLVIVLRVILDKNQRDKPYNN